jgi:hypothetical protein
MKLSFAFFLPLSCLLTACFSWKLFQPPPYNYEMWSKQGYSDKDVQIALLDCGFKDPLMGRHPLTKDELNEANLCMKGDGFIYLGRDKSICRAWKSGKWLDSPSPSCRPDAPLPKRDRRKRLNGPYCRDFPKAEACGP